MGWFSFIIRLGYRFGVHWPSPDKHVRQGFNSAD